MNRRSFVAGGIVGATGLVRIGHGQTPWTSRSASFATSTEVIGDGDWVWTKPPEDAKGLLEPRQFDFTTTVTVSGGAASNLTLTTVVPVNLPEQQVEDFELDTQGCAAQFRQLGPTAAQMVIRAPGIQAGQVIGAEARFRLTLFKQYFGYAKEQFPAEQQFDKQFRQQFVNTTPGIPTRPREVRDLAKELTKQLDHPWDKAHAFKRWVWENIDADKGMPFRGVLRALRDGIGDCEERVSVFAALCRVSGIPARTVWVPNHVWGEFYLKDHDGKGHWIPAHTSGYTWFGFTGAHELVLQKGEGIKVPEQSRRVRFIHDWAKWTGGRPQVRYTSQLVPLPSEVGADPGPGGRIKPEKGPWTPGDHRFDKYLLSGDLSDESPFKKNKADVAPWE